MLTSAPVREQIAAAREDPVRALVVGAGVAGVSAAQLLRRDGLHPVLLERAAEGVGDGYMLALMPLVDPVVDALGVREAYLAGSVALGRYGARGRTGRPLRMDDLGRMLGRYGDYRGISRGELLRALSAQGGTVSHCATITALRQSPAAAHVTIADGERAVDAEFDLVVVADGLHSGTGELLPGVRTGTVDTGWGGWVTWVEPDADTDLGEELWGTGFFVGSYPVKDRLGVFVGGPRSDTRVGQAEFVSRIRGRLAECDARLDRVLRAVTATDDAYYWPLTDRRAAPWAAGRVVLLGDAAAGFLPTAGIGAGMAMESAGVLAGHLHEVRPRDLPAALGAYERAQRPRVEAAQNSSRRLATLVFRRSRAAAIMRDAVFARVSIDAALGPIRKLLATRPAPPGRVDRRAPENL